MPGRCSSRHYTWRGGHQTLLMHFSSAGECRRGLLRMSYCPHCQSFKLQGFVSDRVTLDLRGSGVDQNLDQNQVSNKVRRVCGDPVRQQPEQVSSGQHGSAGRDSIPLKGAVRNADDTLSNRRKEFLSSLRLHRAFYGGLADQLCVSDLAPGDGTACWNGAGVAR
ncbi:hypothetical protein cypCar_00045973 [Cyprinus carpio]|nr:hypothetical protein cypCar_00045973 [Cyprinus carpio]